MVSAVGLLTAGVIGLNVALKEQDQVRKYMGQSY